MSIYLNKFIVPVTILHHATNILFYIQDNGSTIGPLLKTGDKITILHQQNVLQEYTARKNMRKVIIGQVIGYNVTQGSSVYKSIIPEMHHLRIHNLTSVNINLDNSIIVPPATCDNRYTPYHGLGNLRRGFRLGQFIIDDTKLFSTKRLTHLVTDLYYGVISSEELPFYMGQNFHI